MDVAYARIGIDFGHALTVVGTVSARITLTASRLMRASRLSLPTGLSGRTCSTSPALATPGQAMSSVTCFSITARGQSDWEIESAFYRRIATQP